ncbi:MAG: hypothetical protein Q9180_005189, partial [Flavoplaca navasiana]
IFVVKTFVDKFENSFGNPDEIEDDEATATFLKDPVQVCIIGQSVPKGEWMVQGILQPLGSNLFDDIRFIDSSIDSI